MRKVESPRPEFLVMATLLVISTNCFGHITHYVKPTPDTPCPADPCLTLSEYAQQPHHYLTSNTTLLLLPGDHVLSVDFTVENVSNFEILAVLLSSTSEKQEVKVVCKGLVGFIFRNISQLTLHGLTFDSCGKDSAEYIQLENSANYQTAYGISIHSGEDTKIINCSFQDSIGTALGVFYSSLDLRGRNSFMNNCRRCSSRNHTCICLGGGIYANTSIIFFTGHNTFSGSSAKSGGGIFAYYSSLSFKGNSSFRNNSVEVNAGGMFLWHSTVNLTGNCTFSDNSAKDGGGIDTWYSNVTASGNNTFTNNTAKENGGGTDAQFSTLTLTGNSCFTNNSATYGGSVNVWNTTLHLMGNITLQENSAEEYGGGINAGEHSALNFTGDITFRNNSAKIYGGGICVAKSTLNLTGNVTFRQNNSTISGGGVKAWYSTLNFTGNCAFSDNSAKDGGGIDAWYSNVTASGNSTFTNNTAKENGGGTDAQFSTLTLTGNSCFTNNSATYGGSVNVWNTTLHLMGNITLQENSAEEYGGGIHAGEHSALNFTGDITFRKNSAKINGGGICVAKSTLNLAGNITFRQNNSTSFGGGVRAWYSTVNFTGNCTFSDNSAIDGGGIHSWYSNVTARGNSTFRNSTAKEYGGGTTTQFGILTITGNSCFTNNSATHGGSVNVWNTTLHFMGNVTLQENSAEVYGGGIYAGGSSTLNFTGDITFRSNSAKDGGGIYVVKSTLSLTGNITFRQNNSTRIGGGVQAWYSNLTFTGTSIFKDNSVYYSGGAINVYRSTLNMSTSSRHNHSLRSSESFTSTFVNNSAQFQGGGVHARESTLFFEGCNVFSGNSVWYYGGGISTWSSTLWFSGDTSFSSNSGLLKGGGIYGVNTFLYFSGNNSFKTNTAAMGGGEYLVTSLNYLSKNATFTMDSNNATEYGGAVYVEDFKPFAYCYPNVFLECFIQIYGLFEIPQLNSLTTFHPPHLNLHLRMLNNNAQIAGSSIYGGSLDSCSITIQYTSNSMAVNLASHSLDWHALPLKLEPNTISSEPFQVCLCEDGIPNYELSELTRQVYPGELLHFPVVAAGQRRGIVPSVIKAFFSNKHGNTSLAQFQTIQGVEQDCTELYYQVHSSATNGNETLVLYTDGPCAIDGRVLNIHLQFHPCPPGFSLNSSERMCECEPRLQKYTTRCNITERTIGREGEYWVGYDSHSKALILHPHCPFDYCKPATETVSFPLNNTDLQCANNRSGLLCGQCKPGLSLALGNSKCIQCSNLYILLLIPFALAGISLVLLLLIFKLTVAAGTINGLLFYANIVTVNRAIFFPPNQTNILTVFIAWLNLDLGIETCFFDGMDEYTKTWLQFVFPLYVWSLVGLIIISSDYSSRIARLFGSNPVAVLATLFLLSYAKLLRAIIAALVVTFLDYPNEVQVAVWLHDGNIKYFHGKHIVLFLAALLALLIFFVPYTLLLTVRQWLQAKSNLKLFYWINKSRIKPFLDAYQAPYKDRHRYWTGLMLCLRCVLFLVFAFNTQADPSLNLLVIGAVVIGLLTLTDFTGLMYKKMYLNFLEISFILNLGILAIATYYVKLAVVSVSQAVVTYISVGVALTTFVGVLLYHTYQQVWPKLKQKRQQLHHHEEREMSNDSGSEEETRPLLAPTMTVIEFPNPQLLNATDTAGDSQPPKASTLTELREPLDVIDTRDP